MLTSRQGVSAGRVEIWLADAISGCSLDVHLRRRQRASLFVSGSRDQEPLQPFARPCR